MKSGFAHGTRRYVCSRWWSSLHSHLISSIPGKRDKEELNPAGPRSVEKETLRLPHLVPTAIPITPGHKELLGIRSLSTLPCPAALWDLYRHCHYSINLTLWADKRQESIAGGKTPLVIYLTVISHSNCSCLGSIWPIPKPHSSWVGLHPKAIHFQRGF